MSRQSSQALDRRYPGRGGTPRAGPRSAGGFGVLARLRPERPVIRVALADDQELVRADGEQAVRIATQRSPDVLLMDIRMPGLDGIEVTRRIAARPELSSVHVVILTTLELDEYVFEGLRAGGAGFRCRTPTPQS